MADPREEAIRRHYDRRSQPQSFLDQKAASSRPGQVYHTMTSLQDRMSRPGYTPARADTDQLKDLRRDWNRNQKYTPQGMSVSGATSPLDAQKRFMDTTETFRQANKPAYNKMYPLTGGYMDIAEKGGLWGAILSEIAGKTKKGIEDFGDYVGSGITSALAGDSEEEKADYIAKTFGPYPTDIHPGLPVEDDRFVAPPDDIIQTDPSADIIESDLPVEPSPFPNIVDMDYWNWVDQFYDTHNPDGTPKSEPRVIPGRPITPLQEYTTKYEDYIDRGEEPPALPPYEGREFGLGQFINEMPTSRKSDWEDYLEYVQRLGDMPGGHLEYDEWHDMMRRRR